jgi:CubicO group peptidase (beta-lactamase class C family)
MGLKRTTADRGVRSPGRRVGRGLERRPTPVLVALALAGLLGALPGHGSGQGAPADAPASPLPSPVRSLERELMTDVAADDVGSLAAAVVVGDTVIWQAGFGRADRENGALAAPTTIYRVGSISKSITALVLLSLVEEGVVGLDDPVEPHLPELHRLANRSPDHRAITFRDLAAHTAGLAREPSTSHSARGPYREWRRKLVAALPATDVVAPPGTGYRYSNVGYALLGLALERAAGRSYEALVRERVFEPLGMASSFLVLPPAERHRLATGYVNLPGDSIDPRVPRAEHRGRGYKVPNGGVYSTVEDLARLAMAMTGALGDTPVGPAPRAEALSDQNPGRRPDDGGEPGAVAPVGYGLGFQLHRLGDTRIAGHSGTVAGYTAYLAFDPATRAAVILLRSYNHGATNLGATATRFLLELNDELKLGGDPAG